MIPAKNYIVASLKLLKVNVGAQIASPTPEASVLEGTALALGLSGVFGSRFETLLPSVWL